ncbi:MAG: molybdopterin molybdotransferase MoeA [Acidimicrobiales bacterium]
MRILDAVTPGVHIRGVGSDIQAGSVVVRSGTVLGPGHIGVLASVGCGSVMAHRRPRVGVMTTGDELVELDESGVARDLLPGQIRDSNRHALVAALRQDGYEAVDLGIVRDTPEAVESALQQALGTCDALLTTGGVSMGEFDYVKVVLSRLAGPASGAGEAGGTGAGEAGGTGAGVEVLQVAIRPAKPLVLAWLPAGDGRVVPVFGLPGNPVSSLVSYRVIALPALRVLGGHSATVPTSVRGVAGEDLRRRPDGKTHFVRVEACWRNDGRLVARSAGGQMSHQLSAMAGANALAVLRDGEGAAAGDDIDLLLIGEVGELSDTA